MSPNFASTDIRSDDIVPPPAIAPKSSTEEIISPVVAQEVEKENLKKEESA